jgi:hypothetical protein
VLIDRRGIVRGVFLPDHFITRLSPEELLEEVDEHRGQSP